MPAHREALGCDKPLPDDRDSGCSSSILPAGGGGVCIPEVAICAVTRQQELYSPMAYRALPPELEERAKKELNEDPKRRDQDIQHIRDWLSKQPHIRARTDDQWLLTFLRGCKFSLEKTKQKLDMYYTMRTALPEFFTNRDPFSEEMQATMKSGVITMLPGPDLEGRLATVVRAGRMTSNRTGAERSFKLNFMSTEVMMLDEDAGVIAGQVAIIDLKDVTLGHATPLTPWFVKRVMTCSQEGYPLRLKGIHYVHAPPSYETVMNLFQAVMKDKLKKRIHLHTTVDTLLDFFPKSSLPKEYGGDAGTFDEIAAACQKRLESHAAYFREDEKFVADESKRPGKPKSQTDLFGLEGSFRQLTVD
ncbi:alpha-tocopherol transfer protein-like isoform X1 [Schistocerca piceifrons]|uniref:alpha-tocopherol transfer protein-like isoform X1 n=2 Tax=Schistocerca piceifrons TaxID=274613 RepID=UPI001F5FDDE4|nr:alpha-tocopherol transfer protein-like isoform X1 [Schistocerca piceifrons]